MTFKQIQLLLAYLGYYEAEIDGKWGEQSQSACISFQRDYGLDADGIAGAMTQKMLKAAVAGTAYKVSTESSETQRNAAESSETEGNTAESCNFWDGIKYFRRTEFACQCGGKYCDGFPCEPAEETVKICDEIRKRAKVPITISSGIRCEKHNAEVGGVANSNHKLGKAADLICSLSPEKLKEIAEAVTAEMIPGRGGIGLYSWGVHVDNGTYSRWEG